MLLQHNSTEHVNKIGKHFAFIYLFFVIYIFFEANKLPQPNSYVVLMLSKLFLTFTSFFFNIIIWLLIIFAKGSAINDLVFIKFIEINYVAISFYLFFCHFIDIYRCFYSCINSNLPSSSFSSSPFKLISYRKYHTMFDKLLFHTFEYFQHWTLEHVWWDSFLWISERKKISQQQQVIERIFNFIACLGVAFSLWSNIYWVHDAATFVVVVVVGVGQTEFNTHFKSMKINWKLIKWKQTHFVDCIKCLFMVFSCCNFKLNENRKYSSWVKSF